MYGLCNRGAFLLYQMQKDTSCSRLLGFYMNFLEISQKIGLFEQPFSYKFLLFCSKNNGIRTILGLNGSLKSVWSNCFLKQGHLGQIAQGISWILSISKDGYPNFCRYRRHFCSCMTLLLAIFLSSYIQRECPLSQSVFVALCVATLYLWEELGFIFSIPSCQVAIDSSKPSVQHPFLKAEKPLSFTASSCNFLQNLICF